MNDYEYLKLLTSSIYGTYSNPYYQFDTELNYDTLAGILKKISNSNPDISFLKQELKPLKFMEDKIIIGDLSFSSDIDMEYFRTRLLSALRVPTSCIDYTDTIINYHDEYH